MPAESSLGTATVVFTDLEGSTDLRTRLGDEAAHERIRIHEDLIREKIAQFGGLEAKALGDGFMLVFGSARLAINCAVGIQRAVDEHNQTDPAKVFRVRIGINTGEVTHESDDVYGAAVNAASRICAKAQGGQILIPQVVKELAGFVPGLRIVDRGLYWLKGFPQRWRLYEVMWRERRAESEEPPEAPVPIRSRTGVADLPRSEGVIVGRSAELTAIGEELDRVGAGGLRVLALEGEAGIGKTRLLEAAAEAAAKRGFAVLRVGADEELRGPFFLFRTLFATAAAESVAEEAAALEALDHAKEALAGRDTHQGSMSAQEQMLHVFDEVATAIRALASGSPLALLLDDVQWADEDSLRLVRYVARTIAASPILMLLTVRAEAESSTGGIAHLLADFDRMRLTRRIHLSRFTKKETAELLQNLLGAPVAAEALDMLHARAEGVPFFIEEFARAYRESKALQHVGEMWVMTQLTGPSVPASVHSLIERRLAQATPEARALLADAAILGRRFRLSDLARVVSKAAGAEVTAFKIAEALETPVDLGLIAESSEGSHYDYVFSHEQVRATLQESQSRTRRRLIHLAVVDILASEAEDRTNLSALAHHAIQGGDEKMGVACSIKAARASLAAHAPEESLRVCDVARASASSAEERADLLRIKDDALALLERGEERLANLAELSAIVGAAGDPLLELDVKLRRASAAQMSGDFELAAELATQIREAAHLRGESRLELDASLEQGQAFLRSPLGESFIPLLEADFEAAREPFERAAELARKLDEKSLLAASLRELGVVEIGVAKHRGIDIMEGGVTLRQQLFFDPVVKQHFENAKGFITEALRIYEELEDRRGEMSALISLAYANITDFTRRGLAGRMEQIRRLRNGLKRMTTESERLVDEAQMLFSIHVYARSHLILDLALARGREGYEAARAIGNRWLECLFAGGMAESHLALGEVTEADAWLARTEAAALAAPAPFLARRLELWLGRLAAARGEAEHMLEHLERAGKLAAEHSSPAGHCEALAVLAIEAAKLGASSGDEPLLDRAALAAEETRKIAENLPGHLPWEAEAWAATSLVARARGDTGGAAEAARSALAAIEPRFTRALYLDVIWVAARVLIGGQAPEAADLIKEIEEDLFVVQQSTADPDVRRRQFELPRVRELVELSGYQGGPQMQMPTPWSEVGLDDADIEILQQLVTGKSDAEIATAIDATESDVSEHLEAIFTKLGVPSRTAATEFVLTGGIA